MYSNDTDISYIKEINFYGKKRIVLNYSDLYEKDILISMKINGNVNIISFFFLYTTVENLSSLPHFIFNRTVTALREQRKVALNWNDPKLNDDYYIRVYHGSQFEDKNVIESVYPYSSLSIVKIEDIHYKERYEFLLPDNKRTMMIYI